LQPFPKCGISFWSFLTEKNHGLALSILHPQVIFPQNTIANNKKFVIFAEKEQL